MDNFEAIKTVLVKIGCNEEKIRYNEPKHLVTSTRPYPDADNPNGLLLYSDNLHYLFTTRSGSGNLFTLVMDKQDINFPTALERIAKWTGVKLQDIDIRFPFGGFYRGIARTFAEPEYSMKPYSESELPTPRMLSEKFLQEGISLKVQEEWGVRLDHDSNHVLIPIRDYSGRLVGCKARNNDPDCSHDKRWFAYLPYSKNNIVYGYYENYIAIQRRQSVLVFESEKSVLQCASFGCRNAVAIGGHNISSTQSRYLKGLMVKKIILCFDADIAQEELEFEAAKLRSDSKLLRSRIGYILDEDHEYLGKNDSPSDLGEDTLHHLVREKLIWT